MGPKNPWPATLIRILLVALASALLGWITGYMAPCLLAGTLLYLGMHLRRVAELEIWVRQRRRADPPQARGLWGEIFNGLYRLQKRHREQRRRLISLLQRFKDSTDAMPDAAVVLGEHGEMEWWNAAASRLLGLRWPQDEGQRIANLFRHPDFAAFLANQRKREAISLPSPVDESVVLDVRAIPYGEGQRLLLARDITRLHQLERMRSDFVANITHELRTPLTVIHGLAETLADEPGAEPHTERALSLIQQQTGRMRRLVEDLLLLSRLETADGRREERDVDVPCMLRHLREDALALSDARHKVELHVDASLQLHGDDNELRSAFSNLVFNAVKYTPQDGAIALRWYRDDQGQPCFSVRDSGIGIPAHHIPRLTERFYRVDSGRSTRTGGTGLGLAIVKHVLSRHQGRLEVQSRPNVGSTFTCVFPAERARHYNRRRRG